ncbi:MAG: hypothetical protein LBI95_03870, partial [Holosporales bacterium]|nr:hypothetical protein [Holosporales bacterium]
MKNNKVMFVLLFLFIATDACSDVTVFEHGDYKGRSQKLSPGRYNFADLKKSGAIGDDCISSVKVDNGYKVTLYSDPDYKNFSKAFSSDSSYVGNEINDRTSSIIVEKLHDNTTPVTLYSEKDFKGIGQNFGIGKYDQNHIVKIIGNDNTKSIRVNKDYKATVY